MSDARESCERFNMKTGKSLKQLAVVLKRIKQLDVAIRRHHDRVKASQGTCGCWIEQEHADAELWRTLDMEEVSDE
jgi:hypothetical protein